MMPEVGGATWRRFLQAPATESRGGGVGPGPGSCPGPAEAATAVRRKEVWDVLAHRRYTLQLCLYSK